MKHPEARHVSLEAEERFRRQRSLQCFTFSQSRSHFFRHAKGRPQVTQIFSERWGFLWATTTQGIQSLDHPTAT